MTGEDELRFHGYRHRWYHMIDFDQSIIIQNKNGDLLWKRTMSLYTVVYSSVLR